jgi:hypothetical protein
MAPRRPGVQYGLILAGVQMPPLPLPLMVIQLAVRPAFRAAPTRYLTVLQINVHFAVGHLQLNSFHQPGRFDSQNLSIKFAILHALIVASEHLAHYKAGIPLNVEVVVDDRVFIGGLIYERDECLHRVRTKCMVYPKAL